MIRRLVLALVCALASPAFAQESDGWPRFEGLDHQLQSLEQQQADKVQRDQQRDIDRAALPGSGVSEAERGLRKLEYNRELNQLQLEARTQRDRVQRERDLADAALPSRRVAAHSSLVIRDPNRYLLPPAPKGQYYARLEGRFVLVDAMSELVVKVLDLQPTDPTADVPAGARPLPDFSLPTGRIAATSSTVIRDFRSLSLAPPPDGHYYARVDGRIVLVDAKTERPISFVGKPG